MKLNISGRILICVLFFAVLLVPVTASDTCYGDTELGCVSPGCSWCDSVGWCLPNTEYCPSCNEIPPGYCYGAPGCTYCPNLNACKEEGYNCYYCGNRVVDFPEQCDGGEFCTIGCTCPLGYEPDGGNGCKPIQPVCGNGIFEPGEECDYGLTRFCDPITCTCTGELIPDVENPGYCRAKSVCGDNILDEGEECEIFARFCENCRCSAGSIPDPVNFGFCIQPCIPTGADDTCNGADDDCDGTVDEHYVSQPTSCGLGVCAATGQSACVNGQVQDTCVPGAPSPEICNGLDDNCDGTSDEGGLCLTDYYCDNDKDSFFDVLVDGTCNTFNCIPQGCQKTQGNDCNDNNANIKPGAIEMPGNTVDENCDFLQLCNPLASWKNHGQFVSCVSKESDKLLAQGLITEKQKDALVKEAAQSTIGKV